MLRLTMIMGLVLALLAEGVSAQLIKKRPPGCQSWTDSCNSCVVTSRGTPRCTNVTCVRAGPVRCVRRYVMPARCRGYFDGCNVCIRERNGAVHCSTKVCRTYRTPICRVSVGGGRPGSGLPKDCVRWFDGCNTCARSPRGTVICTRRYCGGKVGTPRCLQRRRG